MIGKAVNFFLFLFLGVLVGASVAAADTGQSVVVAPAAASLMDTPLAVPIVYRDQANVVTDRTYRALISDKEWLIPLEFLRQYGRQEIIDGGKGTYREKMVLPEASAALGRKKAVILSPIVSAMVQLPSKMVQGCAYADVWHLTAALGMTFVLDRKAGVLEAKGATFKPTQVKDISAIDKTEKIYVMWDPLTGKPYDKKFMADGVNVMSPSFMQVSKTGIQIDKKKMNQYTGVYTQAGYLVWPLVGNQFDPILTHEILMDDTLQAQLINELLAYALIYNFQGYNLDFENMRYDDRDRLTFFVQRLYERLHPFHLTVSMDVTAISDSPNWSLVYDRKNLAKYLDYMIVMAYDQYPRDSKVSGPVASFPWVEDSLQPILKLVPADKVLLGMPLYMRIWEEKLSDVKNLSHKPVIDATTSPLVISTAVAAKAITKAAVPIKAIAVTSAEIIIPVDSEKSVGTTDSMDKLTPQSVAVTVSAKTLDMNKAAVYRYRYPFDVHWNETLKLYELQFLAENVRNKIWFEDERSLRYKLDLVDRYHLRGGAFWRKGFETDLLWAQLTKRNTVSIGSEK